ncbi:MAG: hypothetical protein OXQ31_18210, partial [Spirochaetaceae bacterium]|nr:hypothetical protein [Spirochaetaceae bacterium]
MTSRDGIAFTRWQTAFVRLGHAGAFDAKGLYVASGIVAGDDEVYLYYTGVSTRHDIDVDATRSGDAQPSAIGRLRLRRDGFVSQDAEGERASLTTVPFELAGDRLQVNMDASSRGCCRSRSWTPAATRQRRTHVFTTGEFRVRFLVSEAMRILLRNKQNQAVSGTKLKP